jgi:hypothetical protein
MYRAANRNEVGPYLLIASYAMLLSPRNYLGCVDVLPVLVELLFGDIPSASDVCNYLDAVLLCGVSHLEISEIL